MLDTVNRDGTSQARISPAQIALLRARLAEAGDRWIVVFSHNPLTDEALAALDESPRVVATIAGNSHKNRIERHGRYWRISTSSLADFPQQARMFRLRETSTGGVALETWMVDHDGEGLAGISRELAYLDAQGGRPQHFAGAREDRNARLYVSPLIADLLERSRARRPRRRRCARCSAPVEVHQASGGIAERQLDRPQLPMQMDLERWIALREPQRLRETVVSRHGVT